MACLLWRCVLDGAWRYLTPKGKTIGAEKPMRINSKGQVTIPAEIRKKAGLLPGTEVEVDFDGASVRICQPARPVGRKRIQEWIERVQGSRKGGMTTDEMMALTRGDD